MVALRGESTCNIRTSKCCIPGNNTIAHYQLFIACTIPDTPSQIGSPIAVNRTKGDRSLSSRASTEDATTILKAAITPDRTVGQCERTGIENAAPIPGSARIPRYCTVHKSECTTIEDGTTISIGTRIAHYCTVEQGEHGPFEVNDPTPPGIALIIIVGDGAVDQGEGAKIGDATCLKIVYTTENEVICNSAIDQGEGAKIGDAAYTAFAHWQCTLEHHI